MTGCVPNGTLIQKSTTSRHADVFWRASSMGIST
jgi:hypothetical protein